PMKRAEIRLVALDPVRGSEANKTRPAVIVSNNGANAAATRLGRGVITVVPITSNVARVFPFQVRLQAGEDGLKYDPNAHAEQVRSVSVDRIGRKTGEVPGALMAKI